jgi:hypothetical protein
MTTILDDRGSWRVAATLSALHRDLPALAIIAVARNSAICVGIRHCLENAPDASACAITLPLVTNKLPPFE